MQEEILNLIKSDINEFNSALVQNTQSTVKDFTPVLSYIFAIKGKQIRPVLGILLAKCLNNSCSTEQNLFLQAIELIHNATLFHDDVIDEADTRRNRKTLQKEFSNKIAILTGDYFLSSAIRNIYTLNNSQINSLFAEYMKAICEGEIEQNLSLNKIIPLEKYILKTERKTALLFELTTAGIAFLTTNHSDKVFEICKNLLLRFGW
jgi:geranylgeranyl pyrophosphate synthase